MIMMKGNVGFIDEFFWMFVNKGRLKSVIDILRLKEMLFVYLVCGR